MFVDYHGTLIAELPGPDARSHRPISLREMGPWLPVLTIGREDQRFPSHLGVDLVATARALLHGVGGASTLTQQLVKLRVGRTRRSLWTKAMEALLALQLEQRWSKAQILEAYLNGSPYGNRLIGVEAASQGYFGKTARALNKAEALYIVGLPQAPTRFNPWLHPRETAQQFERTVRALQSRGVLTPEESGRLRVPQVERHLPENRAPHFLEALSESQVKVRNQWVAGIYHCTLDLELQKKAEQLVRRHLQKLDRADITQAALVILDNRTNSVRALVGSRQPGELNGALSYRNCGSTLKPFLYLTGIDRKVFTAATVLPDTADAVRGVYPDYDPHNFTLQHRGPVRVREALGNSLNVPAVVALSQVGARHAFEAMGSWGLQFDHPIEEVGAGFILGNVGVRLLDLSAAYCGLARGGLCGKPAMLEEVPVELKRVASPESVSIITDILCDNDARRSSFGANSPLAFDRRVAAKTGTSAGYCDAWALGFTREHTVGVWVGNFDARPMSQTASIVAAAPLWRSVIDELFEQDPAVPESRLPRTPICTLSGLLVSRLSKSSFKELFIPGTEPTASSASWYSPEGKPILPLEYAAWCATGDNVLGAEVRPDPARLAIINPRKEAEYVLDANLPLHQQQVRFQVNLPANVVWHVNGKEMKPGADGCLLWQLQEGAWTLEVSNGVASQARHFRVTR